MGPLRGQTSSLPRCRRCSPNAREKGDSRRSRKMLPSRRSTVSIESIRLITCVLDVEVEPTGLHGLGSTRSGLHLCCCSVILDLFKLTGAAGKHACRTAAGRYRQARAGRPAGAFCPSRRRLSQWQRAIGNVTHARQREAGRNIRQAIIRVDVLVLIDGQTRQ